MMYIQHRTWVLSLLFLGRPGPRTTREFLSSIFGEDFMYFSSKYEVVC